MDVEALLERLRELVGESSEPLAVCIEEAGRKLSVSAATVRRMIRGGQLVTVTIGKRTLVPMSELRRVTTPVVVMRTPAPTGPPKRSEREHAARLRRLRL